MVPSPANLARRQAERQNPHLSGCSDLRSRLGTISWPRAYPGGCTGSSVMRLQSLRARDGGAYRPDRGTRRLDIEPYGIRAHVGLA
jgi:hypothetical protein